RLRLQLRRLGQPGEGASLRSTQPRECKRMAIAIALIVLVLGTVLFHFLSPWKMTPLASNWGSMDFTIAITFWVTGFVFVAVNLFLAYAILRFRYVPRRRAQYEPENKRLELWLTGLTTVGI